MSLIGKNEKVEIGRWEDLVFLVELLNAACEGIEYRLEKVQDHKNLYLFIEDIKNEDDYSCGFVEKQGKKAIAVSEAVYEMVMGAYARFIKKS